MTKASEKRDAVLATVIMRLTTEQALDHLKDKGILISRSNYFRIKAKLNNDKLKRLYNIAKSFDSFHLERISEIEQIRKLMWQNYRECKNPSQKNIILKEILNLQPYLSAYLEATKLLIEHKQIKELGNSKKKRKKLQEIEQQEEEQIEQEST